MVTDHAHVIALNRFTGALLWDQRMADWRQNYGATSAPLVVGELVVSGTSGGDEGIRGFVAAFDQATGKEVWRFWTVPRPGEPGSETWRGRDIAHPCASAWLTGTYDAALQTLYWPTGNPCPDYDGSQRLGDNLYSDSILALDAATGRLKWHYQYTPHDVWDWDAQQPPVLVDTDWLGEPRKLLLHANRNGFFYVLDRTSGALLLSKPFVKKLTWAREIGPDGRPVLNADQQPTRAGTTVCPSVDGASNWYSTAYSPATGLYYVQTLEKCSVYVLAPGRWVAGESFYGGSTRNVPGEPGQKVLRAINIQTGAIEWELPQAGPGNIMGRHTRDRWWARLRRRGQWLTDRCRRIERQTALAVSVQHALEGVADDVRLRRAPAHRDRSRPDDRQLRTDAVGTAADQLPTSNCQPPTKAQSLKPKAWFRCAVSREPCAGCPVPCAVRRAP